jgi:hypothetical protein
LFFFLFCCFSLLSFPCSLRTTTLQRMNLFCLPDKSQRARSG